MAVYKSVNLKVVPPPHPLVEGQAAQRVETRVHELRERAPPKRTVGGQLLGSMDQSQPARVCSKGVERSKYQAEGYQCTSLTRQTSKTSGLGEKTNGFHLILSRLDSQFSFGNFPLILLSKKVVISVCKLSLRSKRCL